MNHAAAPLAVLLALCAPTTASAQEIVHGTWTGTMAPPGAASGVPVTFEVGTSDGALSIVMRSAQVEGEMPLQDVRLEGPELTFWWEPGVRVDCALQRTARGSFEGDCTGLSGPTGAGRITMVPPEPGR